MARSHALLAGAMTTVLMVVGGATISASSAQAASGCEPGAGVEVVVDFGSLGGGAPVACVGDGAGRSARSVTESAHFTLEDVRTQPGFICAINAKPDPDASCARTPPANRYWGLFWSDGDDGKWHYATQGADALDVPAGGSIGWRWQSSSSQTEPGPDPNGAPPKSSPSKPPKSGGGGTAGSGSTPTPAPTPTNSTPTPSASATPEAATATPSERPKNVDGKKSGTKADKKPDEKAGTKKPSKKARASKASPSTGSSASAQGGEEVVATTPTSATPSGDDGTDTVLLLAGGAAVVLLGAAAGVLAWRRRA